MKKKFVVGLVREENGQVLKDGPKEVFADKFVIDSRDNLIFKDWLGRNVCIIRADWWRSVTEEVKK